MIQVTAQNDNVWAVIPIGRVDSAGARAFEEAMLGVYNDGHLLVVVDLSQVVFIASAGLRALMVALRRATAVRGRLVLAAVSPAVLQALTMAGLDKLFTIYGNLAEAVAALGGPPPA